MERGWQTKAAVRRWWKRPLYDKFRPFLAGAVLGLSSLFVFPIGSVERLVNGVLPTFVTVAAILAGLFAMALSTLLALIDKPGVAWLKEAGYYEQLVGFHRASFRSQQVFIVAGLAVMVLNACECQNRFYTRSVPVVLAWFGTWAWFSTWRQMEFMFHILMRKDRG